MVCCSHSASSMRLWTAKARDFVACAAIRDLLWQENAGTLHSAKHDTEGSTVTAIYLPGGPRLIVWPCMYLLRQWNGIDPCDGCDAKDNSFDSCFTWSPEFHYLPIHFRYFFSAQMPKRTQTINNLGRKATFPEQWQNCLAYLAYVRCQLSLMHVGIQHFKLNGHDRHEGWAVQLHCHGISLYDCSTSSRVSWA